MSAWPRSQPWQHLTVCLQPGLMQSSLPGLTAKHVCLALLPAVLGCRRQQRSLRRTTCLQPPKAGRAPKPSPSPQPLGRLMRVLLAEGPRPKAEAKRPRNARHVDGCMHLYRRTMHFSLHPVPGCSLHKTLCELHALDRVPPAHGCTLHQTKMSTLCLA